MDSYDHNWHIMDSYSYIYIGYYFHIDQMLAIMNIFLPYISYIGYYVLSIWYPKKHDLYDPIGIPWESMAPEVAATSPGHCSHCARLPPPC